MALRTRAPYGFWDGKTCETPDCDRPVIAKGLCAICYKVVNRRKTGGHLNSHFRRTYGITRAEFQAMLEAQGGRCKICGDVPRDGKRLHVDHCHRTKMVRGLLCGACNTAVGSDETQIDRLRDAIKYLEAFYATEYTGNTEAA